VKKNNWKEKLYKKYPKLLNKVAIETGDGWEVIITELCKLLQFWTDHNNLPQITATQIKEKYGGLRFYYDPWHEFANGTIQMAEALTYRTCEYCGSTDGAKANERGWIKVLCTKCREKEEK
jgi:hypothetical protein